MNQMRIRMWRIIAFHSGLTAKMVQRVTQWTFDFLNHEMRKNGFVEVPDLGRVQVERENGELVFSFVPAATLIWQMTPNTDRKCDKVHH